MDMALNNLQRLICHKSNQPTIQPTNKPTQFTAVDIKIPGGFETV